MKHCNNCNIDLINNNYKNCPLCGAKSVENEAKSPHIESQYSDTFNLHKKRIVRDIFIGISSLIFMISLVISWINASYNIVGWTAFSLGFVWITILFNIFNGRSLRSILDYVFCGIIAFSLVGFGAVGKVEIAMQYIVPTMLVAVICTQYMISFIGVRFRDFCISLILYSVTSIIIFVINYMLYPNWYFAVVSLSLGIISIVGMLVFGRKTLIIQLKKILQL